MNNEQLQLAEKAGIDFRNDGIPASMRNWFNRDDQPRKAFDAEGDLVTAINTGVPVELLGQYSNEVIEVLQMPTVMTSLLKEKSIGSWVTPYTKFAIRELFGRSAPYHDRSQSGGVGGNYEWLTREQYVFQTIAEYGTFEAAVASAAKMNLVADQQAAVTLRLQQDAELFYTYGVEGLNIYGFLNSPGYSAPIVSADLWANMTSAQIYNWLTKDLLAPFVTKARGYVNQNTRIVLGLPPSTVADLAKADASTFAQTVNQMLTSLFAPKFGRPTLSRIVEVPRFEAEFNDGDRLGVLFAENYGVNDSTGVLGFSQKIIPFPVIQELSARKQKWASTTFGYILKYPLAFQWFTGF